MNSNDSTHHFRFNPFSGVLDEDLEHILVPNFDFDELSNQILNSESLAIEFLGKKGRGKTTHLRTLSQHMIHYPIFLLDSNASVDQILEHQSAIVFIDSIHHLTIKERIKIFKAKQVVVYTSHYSRKLECKLAKKEKRTIKFKGVNTKKIETIIDQRIRLASKNQLSFADVSSIKEVNELITKFGDDYRGIMNHLYDKYQ